MNLILILTFCFTSFLSIDSGNSSPVRDAQHNANLGVNDVETGDYQWVYNTSWGGESLQMLDMVIDDANNVYITGEIGPNTNDKDAFLVKFNQNGQEVWNTTLDFDERDRSNGIALDASNNIYIVGSMGTWYTEFDAFIAKYDNHGNHLWNLTWDGESNGNDYGKDIALDASDNIYITGYSVSGDEDVFIAKFNNSGHSLWNTTWDTNTHDNSFGIALDTSNNIYITGVVYTTQTDLLLAKFDSNGNKQWNTTWDGGFGTDIGNRIALDDSNNIYVAGNAYNGDDSDLLLAKFDNSGNQQWNQTWDGTSGTDEGYDLLIDDSNDVYIVGNTYGDGNYQAIIKKFDGSGTEKWNITYDGGWANTDEEQLL
ncbi:MAG: hypothetical protein R6U96_19050 [Promethearchaeia archaeon]